MARDVTGGRIPLAADWSCWPVAVLRSAGMPFSFLAGFAPDAPETADEATLRGISAGACRAILRQDRFAAAVQWQNPDLVRNWLGAYREALLSSESPADVPLSRRDQRETLIAALAQRYCAKNETIGFFGPVAWARLADRGETQVQGGWGLRRRAVFLEWHAVAAVAAALAADPGLSPWLPLRRHPLCSARDGVIYGPRRIEVRATQTEYLIFAALASPRCEQDLRGGLDAPDFDGALASLLASRVILRDLAIPVGDRPERWLMDWLEGLPESAARDRALAQLSGLGAIVGQVAAVAGDPVALGAATAGLDAALGELAGGAGGNGRRRYGRTAVYEDCRLDVDVRIGQELIQALRGPLSLLLDSARWLVTEAAREVVADLRGTHAALAARGRTVNLADLTLAAAAVLSGASGTAIHRVTEDFSSRWAEVLEFADPDGRLCTERAAGLVAALFPAKDPFPWQSARQFSPDLMLRRRPDGPPQWVLGELHLGLNTLENRPFTTQADDLAELLELSRQDYPLGRIVPIWPASSAEVTSRTYPPLALDLPDHYDYWSYALDEGHPAGAASWPGSMLLVTADGGGLWVAPPDASWRRPVTEFLGEFLTALVVNQFRLRPPAPHHGRLTFDDVIVERASWSIPAGELQAASADGADYRCRGLAQALRTAGCPRHLFGSLAGQRKPVYIDIHAPLLLRGFAKLLRNEPAQSAVRLVEMVPEPDALWLRDRNGDPVTSELRMVVSAPPGPDAAGVALPGRPA
jgi:Lantibiotic dehydratase, N terminus